MRRYSTVILLFLTLLAVSRSAPTSKPGPPSNSTDKATLSEDDQSEQNTTTKTAAPPSNGSDSDSQHAQADTNSKAPVPKASMSVPQLIHQIKPVFDGMSLETLKQLREASGSGKIEEFEGILMELYDEQGTEDVFALIENLKNHFEIVPGMLRGAIFKKQNEIRRTQTVPTPTKGNEPKAAGNNREASNKGNQLIDPQDIDSNTEKIVLEDLLKALKKIPTETLKRVEGAILDLAGADTIKQFLTRLQKETAHDLSDELITYATSHLMDLKSAIEVILEAREKVDSAIVPSSAAKKNGTTSTAEDSANQESQPPAAQIDEQADESIKDDDATKPADKIEDQADESIKDDATKPADKIEDQADESIKDDNVINKSDEQADESIKDDVINKSDEDDKPPVPADETDTAGFNEPPVPADETDNEFDKNPDNWDDDNLPDYLEEENNEVIKPNPEEENNEVIKPNPDDENNEGIKSGVPPEKSQKPETKLLGENSPDEEAKTSSGGGGGWFGMWHFLIIFLVIAGIVGTVYVCSHNRKKIREGVGAYIADAASRGRRNRNYRYKPVSS